MRIYRNSIYITGVLTIIAFATAIILHYIVKNEFWCNVCLGIFGSGFLSAITSVISYSVERKKTFENFSCATKALLHEINKFQRNWTLDEKIDFCLSYNNISKVEWDRLYGEFCFLYDPANKKRKYIYTNIYNPIQTLNSKINSHMWHFRWHKDGTGKNDIVMATFVKEIEDMHISVETVSPTKDCPVVMTQFESNLVSSVSSELNGHYYELMYPHIKKEVKRNE